MIVIVKMMIVFLSKGKKKLYHDRYEKVNISKKDEIRRDGRKKRQEH